MFSALSSLSFFNPWILTGLLALPAIWWLIRLTPPAPKIVPFPAIRFLLQLRPDEETTASIPWWLLIFRLLIAALIIIGLAAPVLNQPETGRGNGPAVLIVDNGWTSAPTWDQREATLVKLVEGLYRQQRLVYVLPMTANMPDTTSDLQPVKPEDLSDLAFQLRPKAWANDHTHLSALLPKLKKLQNAEFFWLSDGLTNEINSTKIEHLFAQIPSIGPLTIFRSETNTAPHVIGTPVISDNNLTIPLRKPANSANVSGTLLARSTNGKILFQKTYAFEKGAQALDVSVKLPNEIRNQITRLEIKGSKSSGSVFLLGHRWQRRQIGLVSDEQQGFSQSLLSETHYLEKALQPFYDIQKNTLSELLKSRTSFIALGDAASFSTTVSAQLENWITNGGVLIRFAGPKLANSATTMLPVTLRKGNRNLDGSMSWGKPATLGPIPPHSPFANLQIDPKIKVTKQVLANPSPDLGRKTWAQLEDGTPLVTADQLGKGWVILFHTTATTAWSDLVLSGFFVEMLREVGHLGKLDFSGQNTASSHLPLNLLDGFGSFIGEGTATSSLTLNAEETPAPGPETPAGYYGSRDYKIALNIGTSLPAYDAINYSRFSGDLKTYNAAPLLQFQPPLLILALILILIDILITLILQGRISLQNFTRKAFVWAVITPLAILQFTNTNTAFAEDDIERLLAATLQTRLAYIVTGDEKIDRMSKAGLAGLSSQLTRRTAIEAAAPLPIQIEENDLIFFPLIYWPVSPAFPVVSDAAIGRINTYLKGGGTILFDTRNQFSASIFGRGNINNPENTRLRALLTRLDIPGLSPVPVDHVLTRSFYLMQSFPGRYRDGEVWIEDTTTSSGNDGVASILIGSNDWAAAWAVDSNGRPLAAMIPGGERQREFATRFGINLVMYTLAGNYKADQVHIPTILERLGQ